MSIGISVLGSGSTGNSILIHTETSGVLIDAGFSNKELTARLESLNVSPSIVKALLITHEHTDHTKGARVFADKLGIPTYTTRETHAFLKLKNNIGSNVTLFSPGSTFQIDSFEIHPFTVPHDALDPVGFVIRQGEVKIGVATDLGHINNLISQRLQDCDAILLECNHDVTMLMNSERPLQLKRRILGRHGHLNNEDSIAAFETVITEKCKTLILTHLSGECNCPDMVKKIAQEKLEELNRPDILMKLSEQVKPLETIWVA